MSQKQSPCQEDAATKPPFVLWKSNLNKLIPGNSNTANFANRR